ncbi:hypothetical protein BpHYR1_024046 [Brachionus plicatilis]|uniref:Uncharacterized protein n=1 Tax=Brachionus plicatilis TaxID=10195 RepID=A0A3M7SIK7_BRAPC|nr:hypothetical protein BpHYR1_024046 [Brachionus plicatilis]
MNLHGMGTSLWISLENFTNISEISLTSNTLKLSYQTLTVDATLNVALFCIHRIHLIFSYFVLNFTKPTQFLQYNLFLYCLSKTNSSWANISFVINVLFEPNCSASENCFQFPNTGLEISIDSIKIKKIN